MSIQSERIANLESMLEMIVPIPEDWVAGRTAAAARHGSLEIDLLECRDWKTVHNQLRKVLQLTEGLDTAFSVMLAVSVSTLMPGEQLWVQVISPPSSGKTTLCDALSVNRKWTKTVGTFKGLHSGWQTDPDGEEDNSTIALLKDRTLIVKDADPLLKAPNRDQILADFRDAYDTNCSVQFKNKVKREYAGLRFTVLLCGTEALLELDSADVGARFLTCIIMKKIEEEFESSINHRVFRRMVGSRGVTANGIATTQDDPKMLIFKQLTGGYINYLRTNAADLLSELDVDSNADELVEKIDHLAQFIAFMRARPSKKQEEASTREMSARLAAQLTKLALCLAVVLNRKTVDAEVMRRVRKVGLDSACGRALDLVAHLYEAGNEGGETKTLAQLTGHDEVKERDMLKFLQRIEAVYRFRPVVKRNGQVVKIGHVRWKLTPRIMNLYGRVAEDAKKEDEVEAEVE